MKDVVFLFGIIGMVLMWLMWGVMTGDPVYKTKSRHFLIAGCACTLFVICWAIIYGA